MIYARRKSLSLFVDNVQTHAVPAESYSDDGNRWVRQFSPA
jgi:hypothetical protein